MGDVHDSEVAIKPLNGINYRLLGGAVEGACCFVEHQYSGLLEERTCDVDALALGARESDVALSQISLVSFRTAFNKIRNLCLTCRVLHPIQINGIAGHT